MKPWESKDRIIRLIQEVADMARWDREHKNHWYASWKKEPETAYNVLVLLWKSWKAGKFGVI